MSDLADTRESLFTGDMLEDESYRPLSRLAVLSAGAGVLSLLAALHPLLWVLPLVAGGLSAFTLRWIKRKEDRLTGRTLAFVALVVSCFMLAYPPIRLWTREQNLQRTAKVHADAWFQMVQSGRLHEAHQLHLDPEQRATGGKGWDEVYQRPVAPVEASGGDEPPERTMDAMMEMMQTPAADFERFYQEKPLKELLAHRDEAQIEFKGFARVGRVSASDEAVDLEYAVVYSEAGVRKEQPMMVRMTRTVYGSGEAKWCVERVAAEIPPAA